MIRKNATRKHKRARIPIKEQLKSWVCAGGRCEFRGCSKYLYRDILTLKETNYSDLAHIVAASKDGPRGDDPLPITERNKCDNLMLLCKEHHKLVDSMEHEAEYPIALLQEFKQEHEARIYRLTGMMPEHKTTIVRLRSNIGRDLVSISTGEIYEAISPRYPADEKGLDIDLSGITGTDSKSYWRTGKETIKNQVDRFYARAANTNPPSHISVFAFGPIPFLVFLGQCLGSKIPIDIYQKHRDTGNWIWRKGGENSLFRVTRLSKGTRSDAVVLVLSLSGTIPISDLPKEVRDRYPIYEISLANKKPHPMSIRRRQDLAEFTEKYLDLLDSLKSNHGRVRELHFFPAIPVSIAVVCGVERLPKVHPGFVIYDYNRSRGGFIRTLTMR